MPSRKFIAPGPRLYGKFLCGECQWSELTSEGDLGSIYGGGYLPYSGDTADPRHLFYMARSLRVELDRFSLDKKRRYDHRKWQDFGMERILLPKESFLQRHGHEMLDLAYRWMEPRFGDAALARPRFAYIIGKPFQENVMAWYRDGVLSAFALIVMGDWGAHYWYVFYANGSGERSPSGHGYLVDFLDWAAETGLPHAYLGTTYGNKSRYKSRGIRGVSFWNDSEWCSDRDALASLRDQDDLT
jgi:hypothetical protein